MKTSGDAFPTKAIEEFGKIGVFVRDIDLKVLEGELDLAVHSLKDVPTEGLEALEIACYLPRVGGHDALVAEAPLDELPEGAVVGTSSVRRRALLLRHRPDVKVKPIRGNVPTRVEKWRRGDYDALVLSKAGLVRLDLEAPHWDLDPGTWTPSPGQGVVAVTARRGSEAADLARTADDEATRLEAEVERALLAALGGGCLVPAGVAARLEDGALRLRAQVLSGDGRESVLLERTLKPEEAREAVPALTEALRAKGGEALVAAAREAQGG